MTIVSGRHLPRHELVDDAMSKHRALVEAELKVRAAIDVRDRLHREHEQAMLDIHKALTDAPVPAEDEEAVS